jgi:hypothetical protein
MRILLALTFSLLFFKQVPPIWPQPKDPYHPTIKELRAAQSFLEKGKRPLLDNLKDFKGRAKARLIGKSHLPERGMVAVNCPPQERENCLLLFATFNKNYPEGLKRLLAHAAASDYRGHILYRIGGWPNCEGGDFALAAVPYAFKAAFFQEARRLGFRRVLWLDSSILPLKSLNESFTKIAEEGYLALDNPYKVAPFFNVQAAKFFHLSMEEIMQIPSCSSGILGLDFSDPKACQLLELWHRAAQDGAAYFSARPDQNALSLALYLCGMNKRLPMALLAHGKEKIEADSWFLLERDFVQDQPTKFRY